MYISLIIILCILAISFWLYLFFLISRICLILRICRDSKKRNYVFRVCKLNWIIPINSSPIISFLIETPTAVYPIKLLCLFKKRSSIHFWNSNEYAVKHHWNWLDTIDNLWYQTAKKHYIKPIDFNKVIPKEVFYKQTIPIYVLSPAKKVLKITYGMNDNIINIYPQDKIDNVFFSDGYQIIKIIEQLEKRYT